MYMQNIVDALNGNDETYALVAGTRDEYYFQNMIDAAAGRQLSYPDIKPVWKNPEGWYAAVLNGIKACAGWKDILMAILDRSITTLVVPEGLTKLGKSALRQAALMTSLDLPTTLTEIDAQAIQSASTLTIIICRAETPPTLGSNALQYIPATCAIRVPADSVSAYKAASGWSDRADYISAIQEE